MVAILKGAGEGLLADMTVEIAGDGLGHVEVDTALVLGEARLSRKLLVTHGTVKVPATLMLGRHDGAGERKEGVNVKMSIERERKAFGSLMERRLQLC